VFPDGNFRKKLPTEVLGYGVSFRSILPYCTHDAFADSLVVEAVDTPAQKSAHSQSLTLWVRVDCLPVFISHSATSQLLPILKVTCIMPTQHTHIHTYKIRPIHPPPPLPPSPSLPLLLCSISTQKTMEPTAHPHYLLTAIDNRYRLLIEDQERAYAHSIAELKEGYDAILRLQESLIVRQAQHIAALEAHCGGFFMDHQNINNDGFFMDLNMNSNDHDIPPPLPEKHKDRPMFRREQFSPEQHLAENAAEQIAEWKRQLARGERAEEEIRSYYTEESGSEDDDEEDEEVVVEVRVEGQDDRRTLRGGGQGSYDVTVDRKRRGGGAAAVLRRIWIKGLGREKWQY